MSNSIFQFGQPLPGYSVPVLNERAVRAAAGIVFFFAIVAFMNAWLLGNFQPTRVFVVAFLIDFTIRIFINPDIAPTLILGQWFVRKQQPEYVGAPQKRFAWAIGFALALTMFYLVVLKGVIGPINLIVCALCLTLLFFETAFGICLGCIVYKLFNKTQPELCPGGVCEYTAAPGAGGSLGQGVIVLAFLAAVAFVGNEVVSWNAVNTIPTAQAIKPASVDPAEQARCKVPDFAKAIGHEEKWKLHNNCK